MSNRACPEKGRGGLFRHPILQAGGADVGLPQRNQRIVVHCRAKIGRFHIRDDRTRIALRAQIAPDVLVQRQQLRGCKILDGIPWSANHGKSYNDFLVIIEK